MSDKLRNKKIVTRKAANKVSNLDRFFFEPITLLSSTASVVFFSFNFQHLQPIIIPRPEVSNGSVENNQ